MAVFLNEIDFGRDAAMGGLEDVVSTDWKMGAWNIKRDGQMH